MADRQPLLGKLVKAGFGGGRLEVMATTSVVFLLDDAEVAARFTTWLSERSGVALPTRLGFVAEGSVKGGRIDVAGYEEDRMRVALEAKFHAGLSGEQLLAYIPNVSDGVLGVVVPASRNTEADRVLDKVSQSLDSAVSQGCVCRGTRSSRGYVRRARMLPTLSSSSHYASPPRGSTSHHSRRQTSIKVETLARGTSG